MPRKAPPLTKSKYVDRFVARYRRLDRHTPHRAAEDLAHNGWIEHRDREFRDFIGYDNPEKDAECEYLFQCYPPEV